MKTTAALSALALVLSAASLAQAETLTPTHDTYVRNDGSGPYGSAAQLYVKTATQGSTNNRVGLVRFAYSNTAPVSEAALELTVSGFNNTTYSDTATFTVWGINNGSGCGEAFNEDGAVYSGMTAVLSGGWVNTSSSCLWDADTSLSGKQPIGQITVHSSQVGETVSLSTPALADFLEDDTNGRVTFIIAREYGSNIQNTYFASKEHSVLAPPTLKVSHPGTIDLSDILEEAVQNPDGSWHLDGDLPIPMTGGTMVVPGASVDMTFNASGQLQTISGTVGMPELPGTGLFSALGPLTSSGPYLQIGYDYPSAFDTIGLPLDPSNRYIYFLEQSGASVSWGPVSCETPNAGATLIAVEPEAPTVLAYTDQLFGESPINSVAIGVSGDNGIPFDPWYNQGVEAQMTSFDGDFYLGGSVSIPTAIPAVDVTVTGDLTIDVADSVFASGSNTNWMNDMGINGEVELEAGIGPFSASYYLGGATFRYHNGTKDWIAFSAVAAPDDLYGLPFTPKAYMQVNGYLHETTTKSFLHFEGEMKFGASFAKQKITAEADIFHHSTFGWMGTMSGTAKFSNTTVSVAGAVNASYAVFTGSLTHKFGVSVGGYAGTSIEADVDVTFDSRNTPVDLDGKLKFCWKDAITGKHCDATGGSVTVNSSGQIKICGNVPGGGTKCDTLS